MDRTTQLRNPKYSWQLKCFAFVIALSLIPVLVFARDFRVGEVEGLLDVTLAYGLLARMQGRDKTLLAIANGGKAVSANFDNGNLNYDKGLVSNLVKSTGELTLRWHNFGAYVRGFALYDFESELNNRARTDLSRDARDIIGKNADLLEQGCS